MPPRERKTILVVEDDDVLLRLLVVQLRDYGYNVHAAHDGQEGLECLVSAAPDLVLTNIHMPRMNGFQLLRAVKKLDPTTPVILTTGFGHFKKFFPDQAARADAFIEKPFEWSAILACIDRLLAQGNAPTLDANYDSTTRHLCILLIDDDEPTVDIWVKLLEPLQAIILKAYNGSDGLMQFMTADSVDLVISGINQPGENGYMITRTIRVIDAGVPIIACSGNAKEEHALASGADVFLEKPFPLEQFVETLKKAARVRNKHDLLVRLEEVYCGDIRTVLKNDSARGTIGGLSSPSSTG